MRIRWVGLDSSPMEIAQFARDVAQVVPDNPRSPHVTVGTEDVGTVRRGVPVLFLHGWGVGPQSYAAPLRRLRHMGCDVHAPAQPGFGGAASLPGEDCNFRGYARWAAEFLETTDVDEPVMVVGHSFGGGVAIQFAHDYPDRVRGVVTCNGVGGFPWSGPDGATAAPQRPLWEWGRHLGADLFALPTLTRVLPALLGEAVPNLLHNPIGMWRVGEFVRKAYLLDEIAHVAEQGTPVTVVWSDRDRLVPHAGFAALCRSAQVTGEVVPGTHSWLIADPQRFADIVLRATVDAGVVEATLAAAG
jgi:pimeloyl-ACP methyl ester carboxylesterase